MGSGSAYVKRLPREECEVFFEEILDVAKNEYSFFWNQDSKKEKELEVMDIPGESDYLNLSIIEKNNEIVYRFKSNGGEDFYTKNGEDTFTFLYDNLRLGINSKNWLNSCKKLVWESAERVLDLDFQKKIKPITEEHETVKKTLRDKLF